MFRLDLGGGVVAFETEGEADHVGNVNPNDLIERNWPPEVVENLRRYQERLHSEVQSRGLELDSASTPHQGKFEEL